VTSSDSDNAGHVGGGGVDVDRQLGKEFQEPARLRLTEATTSLGDQQDVSDFQRPDRRDDHLILTKQIRHCVRCLGCRAPKWLHRV